MCGIIGYSSLNDHVEKNKFIEARDIMKYRGPDDKGIWISTERCLGLGHRRLSIIDLSSNGNQPMKDESENI